MVAITLQRHNYVARNLDLKKKNPKILPKSKHDLSLKQFTDQYPGLNRCLEIDLGVSFHPSKGFLCSSKVWGNFGDRNFGGAKIDFLTFGILPKLPSLPCILAWGNLG